jgi:hypothetical protein
VIDVIMVWVLAMDRAILSAWPVGAVSTFVLVQRIKRLAWASKYEMNLLETEILAFLICNVNCMLWMHGLFDVPLKAAAIHTWFIAITYVASIKFIMSLAKRYQPEAYQALKTKRRSTDFDGDATIPDTPSAELMRSDTQ